MEALVLRHAELALGCVVGMGFAFYQAFQSFEIRLARAVGGQFRRQAFDGNAGAAQILESFETEDRYARRAVGKRLESLLRHQLSNRFAHRLGAGAEQVGHFLDLQRLAGLEAAAHQQIAQLSMYARLHGFPQNRHDAEIFARKTDHFAPSNCLIVSLIKDIIPKIRCSPRITSGKMLALRNVTKDFGGLRAVDDVSFTIARGTISGLIGPNGAGKSTLFNVLAGAIRPSGGQVVFDGERIDQLPNYRISSKGLMRTFQIPRPFGGMTGLENLMLVPAP